MKTSRGGARGQVGSAPGGAEVYSGAKMMSESNVILQSSQWGRGARCLPSLANIVCKEPFWGPVWRGVSGQATRCSRKRQPWGPGEWLDIGRSH